MKKERKLLPGCMLHDTVNVYGVGHTYGMAMIRAMRNGGGPVDGLLSDYIEHEAVDALKECGAFDFESLAIVGGDAVFPVYGLDSVQRVTREFVMFLYNLDPYLVCDAFEYGESPEEYAARISETVTAADVLGEIEDSRELVTDEPDNLARLDGFRKRIEALKAA